MQPLLGGSGRDVFRPRTGLALLTAGLLLSGPAGAMNTTGQCVGNLSAPLSPGNSCTANDVTLVLVAAGEQNDGCINTSDTVNLLLGARLETTSDSVEIPRASRAAISSSSFSGSTTTPFPTTASFPG